MLSINQVTHTRTNIDTQVLPLFHHLQNWSVYKTCTHKRTWTIPYLIISRTGQSYYTHTNTQNNRFLAYQLSNFTLQTTCLKEVEQTSVQHMVCWAPGMASQGHCPITLLVSQTISHLAIWRAKLLQDSCSGGSQPRPPTECQSEPDRYTDYKTIQAGSGLLKSGCKILLVI